MHPAPVQRRSRINGAKVQFYYIYEDSFESYQFTLTYIRVFDYLQSHSCSRRSPTGKRREQLTFLPLGRSPGTLNRK